MISTALMDIDATGYLCYQTAYFYETYCNGKRISNGDSKYQICDLNIR